MRGARGLSLAEVLVALLITTIVLLGAGAFFTAVGRQASREGGRSPGVGGPTDAALGRLERDLTMATSLPRHEGRVHADGQTLLLTLPDGTLVQWRQDGDRLVRAVMDDRRRFDEKRVLDRVLFVDLRTRSARLFEVGLRRKEEPVRRRTVLLRNLRPDDDEERGR